ncbi:hypothetical protein ACHAWF_006993, partial [Thalassiosira exigua]
MVVTPPEEIALQHARASELVASSLPCAPRIDRGEVPLRWKVRPTCAAPSARESASPSSGEGAGADEIDEGAPASNGGDGILVVHNPNSLEGGSVEVLDEKLDPDRPGWCVSSRGQVDVSSLAALIAEGVDEPASVPPPASAPPSSSQRSSPGAEPPGRQNGLSKNLAQNIVKKSSFSASNLWDERNAAKHNVKIVRPSHDAWGIKKIVLVFCDDFLRTIYTLPWYRETNDAGRRMRAALKSILDVLNINEDRLVRCLLAGLPPGVTIPVHHDTGEWVKYAHRVHVPVVVPDPSKILFRCGLTEATMERVDCNPGHVFEMNNQAKHAVTNAGDRYRVHLILDYVDPSFFELRKAQSCPCRRVDLSPGEVLTQTRRSIDRALDAGSTSHPAFLILGAQKAGTTTLYEALNRHPWIVRAKRRETHCLDWRWDSTLRSTEERRAHCGEFYHAEKMGRYPSLITGDSTPSYLLDYARVIPRVKECFPHGPKLMIMTRDPIKRAVSHYAMVTSSDGTPEQMKVRGTEWRDKTLEEVLEEDVRHMKEDGLIPYWDAETKSVDMEIFDQFTDTLEEDRAWERYVTNRVQLNTGSYAPLGRGLYALQCRRWFRSFPRSSFLVTKLEDVSDKGTQWAIDRACAHLGLPRFDLPPDAPERSNAREYRDPLAGKDEVRAWLERFYAPQNRRFGRMMREEMGGDEG